jgi:hypothetical protein
LTGRVNKILSTLVSDFTGKSKFSPDQNPGVASGRALAKINASTSPAGVL